MVLELKKLSEDEKIKQQMEARADYESRIATARGVGYREGKATALYALVTDGLITLDDAVKRSGLTREEFMKHVCT